jgi:hypothetical protein
MRSSALVHGSEREASRSLFKRFFATVAVTTTR